MMSISDVLFIFVEMWECGSIKKYFKNIYVFIEKVFEKNSPRFHIPLSVRKILQKPGRSMKIQSGNCGKFVEARFPQIL